MYRRPSSQRKVNVIKLNKFSAYIYIKDMYAVQNNIGNKVEGKSNEPQKLT